MRGWRWDALPPVVSDPQIDGGTDYNANNPVEVDASSIEDSPDAGDNVSGNRRTAVTELALRVGPCYANCKQHGSRLPGTM